MQRIQVANPDPQNLTCYYYYIHTYIHNYIGNGNSNSNSTSNSNSDSNTVDKWKPPSQNLQKSPQIRFTYSKSPEISGNLRESPGLSGNLREKTGDVGLGVSWGFGCQVWGFPGGSVLSVSFVALGAQGCLLCFQWVHYFVSQVHGFIGY